MIITNSLVEWAMAAKYSDISPNSLSKAKQALLDSTACMVGASRTEVKQALERFMSRLHCSGRATVLGTDLHLDPRDAAFANATLANAMDYDDTYEDSGKALCHPGATLVATSLAASTLQPTSGQDLLTALAVGYEVTGRIAESIQPSPELYIHVWGLNQYLVLGAAVVASRILGLDLDTARHAFGIAGAAANIPSAWKLNWDDRSQPLSWQKDMVSWAAEAGLQAVLLAESGFQGCLDILDGDQGFWRMCASDRFDSTRITEGLGELGRLANLAFKPYPSCRWTHPILEAFEQAYMESDLEAEEIVEIQVYTLSELANHFAVAHPKHMMDAEFSVPYTVSMVAQGIPAGPQWHTTEVRQSRETYKLTSKVRVFASVELDHNYFENKQMAAQVVVQGGGNRSWRGECTRARGGRERPLTMEEHQRKVTELIDPFLGKGAANRLSVFIESCESEQDFIIGLDDMLAGQVCTG
jgi:2-methylcitrate dehydratase PrpD